MKNIILPTSKLFKYELDCWDYQYCLVDNWQEYKNILSQNDTNYILNIESPTKRKRDKQTGFEFHSFDYFNFGNNCNLCLNISDKIGNFVLEHQNHDFDNNRELREKKWNSFCSLQINSQNYVEANITCNKLYNNWKELEINGKSVWLTLEKNNVEKVKISNSNVENRIDSSIERIKLAYLPNLKEIDLSDFVGYVRIPKIYCVPSNCQIKINPKTWFILTFYFTLTDDNYGCLDTIIMGEILKNNNLIKAFNEFDYLGVHASEIFDKKYLFDNYYQMPIQEFEEAAMKFYLKFNNLYYQYKIEKISDNYKVKDGKYIFSFEPNEWDDPDEEDLDVGPEE